MMRREEKRRKFHEALLRTLYPPPSPPSPPPPLPPPLEVDDESFDVTLVDPEEYFKIGSSSRVDGEEEDDGIESETTQKLSRAQRKRLRKMRLKEEAVRRGKLIGPLPPLAETGINDGRGADVQSNGDDSGGSGGGDGGGGDGNGEQSVRRNALEKEEKSGDKDKMGKVKKRREAKKLTKESSKSIQTHDSIPETRN